MLQPGVRMEVAASALECDNATAAARATPTPDALHPKRRMCCCCCCARCARCACTNFRSDTLVVYLVFLVVVAGIWAAFAFAVRAEVMHDQAEEAALCVEPRAAMPFDVGLASANAQEIVWNLGRYNATAKTFVTESQCTTHDVPPPPGIGLRLLYVNSLGGCCFVRGTTSIRWFEKFGLAVLALICVALSVASWCVTCCMTRDACLRNQMYS